MKTHKNIKFKCKNRYQLWIVTPSNFVFIKNFPVNNNRIPTIKDLSIEENSLDKALQKGAYYSNQTFTDLTQAYKFETENKKHLLYGYSYTINPDQSKADMISRVHNGTFVYFAELNTHVSQYKLTNDTHESILNIMNFLFERDHAMKVVNR